MSETRQKQEIKDLLEWLEDKKGGVASIWGMDEVLNNMEGKTDQASLRAIFSEDQLRFIRILVKNVVHAIEFHNSDSLAESHPDLREDISKIDAKMRNHRHNLDQTYSAKAEF